MLSAFCFGLFVFFFIGAVIDFLLFGCRIFAFILGVVCYLALQVVRFAQWLKSKVFPGPPENPALNA